VNRLSLVAIAALLVAAILTALPMLVEAPPAEIVTSLPRTERVVDLPEDDQWQLMIIYTDKTRNPADRALAAMFATTPRLQSLVAQTKVYEYASLPRRPAGEKSVQIQFVFTNALKLLRKPARA
jgi:hypothetical protein